MHTKILVHNCQSTGFSFTFIHVVDFGIAENKSTGVLKVPWFGSSSQTTKCPSDILDFEIGCKFTIGLLFQTEVNSKTLLGILTMQHVASRKSGCS